MKYGMNLAWQLQLSEGKFIIDTAQLSALYKQMNNIKVNSLAIYLKKEIEIKW